MTEGRDDELVAAVARVYAAADPPPARLLAAASAVLAWRRPDAALATLLVDSAVAGQAAGIRSASAESRMLSFAEGDTVVDVELVVADGEIRLVGQVSRPAAAPLEVRHRDGVWTGSTDALGRFAVDGLPVGPLRITWGPEAPGGPLVSTPTILS
ncbi:hypothetical protein [Dactylosporangium sp. CA-092794]|uniref:hypothetical protein n=1 Tax=Dactylosporangium sp. CA-092794 TaxID=3239929 RepID=UPI003D8F2892